MADPIKQEDLPPGFKHAPNVLDDVPADFGDMEDDGTPYVPAVKRQDGDAAMAKLVYVPMSSGGGGSLPAGGTTGQVLTKQSAADGDADWETPSGGGGGMVLLEQHTASGSASLDFTTAFTSTYDTYHIRIVNLVPSTNATDLYMRFSTNGGSSYDTSTIYEYIELNNSTSNVGIGWIAQLGVGYISLFPGIDNGQSIGVNARIELYDPLSTTLKKACEFWVNAPLQAVARRYMNIGSGWYNQTAAVNAVRFIMNSGNIASGTIRVYGLAK